MIANEVKQRTGSTMCFHPIKMQTWRTTSTF